MAEIDAAFELRMARAALHRWRDRILAHGTRGTEVRAAVYARVPDVLRQRIQRALDGCTSELEIRMVFASVQDHQLRGK